MVKISPRKIPGKWRDGYALDLHTVSSICVGYNEYGHPVFDTKYTELGELLFKLKSRHDESIVPQIIATACGFVQSWKPKIDIIIPVPPSTKRAVQPVMLIASGLANGLGIPLSDCIKLTRDSAPIKSIHDYDERIKALEGLFTIDRNMTSEKSVLLFDDLFRSGATMNAITQALYETGAVLSVFALALTQTRVHR